MQIPDDVFDKIEDLSEQGNEAMDNEQYSLAIEIFMRAYKLLPEPKDRWEAYIWLQASIGDAYFQEKEYEISIKYFQDIFNSGEVEDPFVMLRLGQNYYSLKEYELAKEFLLRAYQLDGITIFEEDMSFYNWLSQNVNLSSKQMN